MSGQNVSRRAMKRCRANSSSNQNCENVNMRQVVNVPDDTWLEALKFLKCPNWSQKRFVSRQINGIAQRNMSRLPKMVIDSATMHHYMDPPGKKQYPVVAFDTTMQQEKSTQWFKKRGFTLDAPVSIPADNALIGFKQWIDTSGRSGNVSLCIHGRLPEKIPLELKRLSCWFNSSQIYRKPVLFCAQFNPALNQYSWNYLAHFLKCIFHPTSYIKEIKMFAVNQNFMDSLKTNIDGFDNDPHYIRCESFSIEGIRYGAGTNIVHFPDVLKWLERNVRAEKIHILDANWNAMFDPLANFLLDPSGAKLCASLEIKIYVSNQVTFLNILIEKFHKIPLVEGPIPTIKFSYYRNDELPAHLGSNLIAQEVDSEGAEALYMISNGQNRLRISFRCDYCWCGSNCRIRIYSV